MTFAPTILTTTYGNDAAGNRTSVSDPMAGTSTFAYSALSQMTHQHPAAASGATTTTYNGDGQRTRKAPDGESPVNFIYDHNNLLQEVADDDETLKTYTMTGGDGYGNLISEYQESGGGGEYYHQFDANANSNAVVNSACDVAQQWRYQAFGLPIPFDGGGDPSFGGSSLLWGGQKGYYFDADTQLYLLGAGTTGRWYDPATGKYLSEDPTRYAGGDNNLQRYVGNNPVNQVDPNGQQTADLEHAHTFTYGKTRPDVKAFGHVLVSGADTTKEYYVYNGNAYPLVPHVYEYAKALGSIFGESKPLYGGLTPDASKRFDRDFAQASANVGATEITFAWRERNDGSALIAYLPGPADPEAYEAFKKYHSALGDAARSPVVQAIPIVGSLVSTAYGIYTGNYQAAAISAVNLAIDIATIGPGVARVVTDTVTAIGELIEREAAELAPAARAGTAVEKTVSTDAAKAGAGTSDQQAATAAERAAAKVNVTSSTGVLNAAGNGTTVRTLPIDVDSKITLLRPGDPLPANLKEIPKVAATHLRTGEIFVNAEEWAELSDPQKARVFFEELSHQKRVLATPVFLRPVREAALGISDLYKFIEEFRAATYATNSAKQGFSYAWNYPGLVGRQLYLETGFVVIVVGASGYDVYRVLRQDKH